MKRLLLCLSLIALQCAFSQTTNYPGSLDSNSSLFVMADNVQSTLSSTMLIGDSVAVVANPAGFVANMVVTICDTISATGKCTAFENMKITGVAGNVLTVTRGFAGTSAAAHANGKLITALFVASNQKVLKDAVVALETGLGANFANLPSLITTLPNLTYLSVAPSGAKVEITTPGASIPEIRMTYDTAGSALAGSFLANTGAVYFQTKARASGYVNVAGGTSVTWVSGNTFPASMSVITINGRDKRVTSNTSTTATLAYSSPTLNGAVYSVAAYSNFGVFALGGASDSSPSTMEFSRTAFQICGRPDYPCRLVSQWNSLHGVVDIAGTAVTWVAGDLFDTSTSMVGSSLVVGGTAYNISAVADTTHLTLTAPGAGTQTGVQYYDFSYGRPLGLQLGNSLGGGVTNSFHARALLNKDGLWMFGQSVGNVATPLASVHAASGSTAVPGIAAGQSAPNVFSTADGTLISMSASAGTLTVFYSVPEDYATGAAALSGYTGFVTNTLVTVASATTAGLNATATRITSVSNSGCTAYPNGVTPTCRFTIATGAADGTYTVLTDPNLTLTVIPGVTTLTFNEANGQGEIDATDNGSHAGVLWKTPDIKYSTTFAAIAAISTANATVQYCSDCKPGPVCAGGGLGAWAERINSVWVCNGFGLYPNDVIGANVASANVITATGSIFHITGAALVKTINLPTGFVSGQICAIPDGAFTTDATGNIAIASTAVVSKRLCWTYDPGTVKFYPSY